MATPGELVRCVSETLGFPLGAVVEIDRSLAEDGLRSKSGRGRSAARVTPRDAANLLIATAASPVSGPTTVKAVNTYLTYAELPVARRRGDAAGLFGCLSDLGPKHTFGDALEALVAAAAAGEIEDSFERYLAHRGPQPELPMLRIDFAAPVPRADIFARVPDGNLLMVYERPIATGDYRDSATPYEGPRSDLTQTRTFTLRTVLAIGRLLAGEPEEPDARREP